MVSKNLYIPRAGKYSYFVRPCGNEKCPHGGTFTTDNPHARFCCEKCQARNRTARRTQKEKANL